jgi:hypothetical protein
MSAIDESLNKYKNKEKKKKKKKVNLQVWGNTALVNVSKEESKIISTIENQLKNKNDVKQLAVVGKAAFSMTDKILMAFSLSGLIFEYDQDRNKLNPKTEKFTLLEPKMQHERAEAAAVLMGDGTVLIFGGYEGEYGYTDTIERYDPVSNTFTPVGEMLEKRAGHSATLLLNGKILICGGRGSFDTEIYDPKNNRSIEGPNMQKVRDRHSASLIIRPKTDEIVPRNFESQLNDYEVLLFGGDFRRRRVTSEIYDPVKMKFNIGPSVTVYD